MKKYREISVLTIGTIIMLVIFWNRLLKRREEYSLDALVLTNLKILSTLLLIILLFCLFCKTIISLLMKDQQHNSFLNKIVKLPFMKALLEFIHFYLLESPKKVYEKIYESSHYPVHFLTVTSISYVIAHCYYPNTRIPLIKSLGLMQLPKILAAIIFFIDVCYYHQISLFVKYTWLLIIPLMTKLYFYICEHNSKRNIEYFDLYVEFYQYAGESQCYIRFKTPLPSVENPLDITKVKLNTISNWYSIYGNIRNYLKLIKSVNETLEPYFSLITYALFLVSWSYYLWYVIN